MTAQDDALLKALNDAMLDFNRACTREDAEGDPRDWVYAAYLHAWKAGRAYEASRATADRAELEALRAGMSEIWEKAQSLYSEAGQLPAALLPWMEPISIIARIAHEAVRPDLAAARTAERRPADGDGGA